MEKTTRRSSPFPIMLLFVASKSLTAPQSASAFCPIHVTGRPSMSLASSSLDDDLSRQMERAREVLAQSKAKMEAIEQAEVEGEDSKRNVPFFAVKDTPSPGGKKEKVTKSTNKQGLITTDGEKMAKLSESEEWETRPLGEVFRDERGVTENPLADRDVAASIMNLRLKMQNADFKEIFDSRNRFIGEQ